MRNNMFPTSSVQFEERENPFKNLGTDTNGLMTAEQCMVEAGLDWRVELRPTFAQLPNGEFVEVKHNKIPNNLMEKNYTIFFKKFQKSSYILY